jgi:hypothetical protein
VKCVLGMKTKNKYLLPTIKSNNNFKIRSKYLTIKLKSTYPRMIALRTCLKAKKKISLSSNILSKQMRRILINLILMEKSLMLMKLSNLLQDNQDRSNQSTSNLKNSITSQRAYRRISHILKNPKTVINKKTKILNKANRKSKRIEFQTNR